MSQDNLQQLVAASKKAWKNYGDHAELERMLGTLDAHYDLSSKLEADAGVADVILEMLGRLAAAYENVPALRGKRILDIACGSNTSRAPAPIRIPTPFGELKFRRARRGYAAKFEPWMCRILLALGALPVGVDMGDLDGEAFEHHPVDLGRPGALSILPDHSFDGLQDSRLFGSPEFTRQFPREADRLAVAREIVRQEKRLLKDDGVVIHSDAAERLARASG